MPPFKVRQLQGTPTGELEENSPAVACFLLAISRLRRLAHHPACQCYADHVFWIWGHPVCLGCSCLLFGAVTGLGVLALRLSGILVGHDETQLFAELGIGLVLFAPTLLQPFIQTRPFKVGSRLCLGFSIVWLWQAAMFELPFSLGGYVLRIIFVGVFVTVYRLTKRFRSRFARPPCESCSGGRYPFCPGNRDRVLELLPALRSQVGHGDQAFVAFVEAWAQVGADNAAEPGAAADGGRGPGSVGFAVTQRGRRG
jgi:hypothetical protein